MGYVFAFRTLLVAVHRFFFSSSLLVADILAQSSYSECYKLMRHFGFLIACIMVEGFSAFPRLESKSIL